ncbi:MAG TPA: amino acid adenylation domain-containing protein [Pyrinomonadaceae bacterium]|nr:amino acid adenylation domain-containing protein [Pyrinomonadaceae bacterium]
MTICSERLDQPGTTVLSLVDLLQQRAAAAPERVAYRFLGDGETGESRITYGELDRRARVIATCLQEMGARGERALLLYPAGLTFIEAFFGCLYAGVIAVPSPLPRRNAQRLQLMVMDSGATIALTNAALLTKMESLAAQLRLLATDTIDGSQAETYLEPELSPDSLAYLQYTSGSTSTPKGVMVTHGNVRHNSASIHRGFAHTPDSRALTWLPHFHDMGLIDGIIQPLYGGFPGILMSPVSFLQQPLRWLEAITRFQVTHTGGPNFAYDLCVRRVNKEQRARLDLRSWRVAYNGAEPVRFETLRRFANEFRECGFRREAFYPAYGLAEATLKVTGAEVPVTCTVRFDALEQHRVAQTVPEQEVTRTLVGCGQAGLDTEIEIVDIETSTRCDVNTVGEIWVHGPGVAAGYWNRPEETEATFHVRLADADEGKTYLRTGDLGFVRDGELFVTGRVKDLIIIRGRNLYPHDLELAVEQCHEALRAGGGAAFSLEVEDEERLVIVQELEPRRRGDPAALLELIRQTLADEFEVQPYAILLVKAGSVPKTSSGKIQRSECRTRFETGSLEALAEWRAPLDSETDNNQLIETAELSNAEAVASWIRGQLAAKLRIDAAAIDVDSSITRYGVDSLIAVELTHSIETQLGVLLPMSEFISSQSITQIAARCFELVQAKCSAPAFVEEPTQSNTFPLSYGQQSLWFLQQLAPESVAYNIASAIKIKTKPDVAALRRAFQSLVERHAALRTTFSAVQGKAVQHVHEQRMASFETVDASLWDDAALAERLRAEAHRPFDLEHGPLLRALLFSRADEEHVLLVVAHHIVIDFWSLAILMRELGELYRDGQTATSHTSNYCDYVRWEQRLLAGEAGERLAAFWQKELAGELPVLDLHTDRPRPTVQTFRGASEPLRLDAPLTARLKALARANDATLFITLLAAFKALLYRYTGQEDLLVGSPTAGRHSAQFASTVGYFVNPVVLRSSPKGALSFAEFLQQVRHTTLAAFAHQEYPFALLVKQLQPERDPSRSPLFQAMFTLNKAQLSGEEAMGAFSLGEAGARMNLGGLPLESMRLDQRIAQFDLSLTMVEVGNELSASLEYNTDLFDAVTIQRLLGHFQTLLQGVIAGPWKSLDRLPLLNDDERHLLLDEWSVAVEDRATGKRSVEHAEETGFTLFVQEMFEQQVERHPESTAVVFDGARLSYAELNARANRLAHYLRRGAVGMDVPVAICVERSLEMFVAVLGVLKAGGAYVPLDPRYPPERLAFMLSDTGAPWLLTQRHLLEGLPQGHARALCLDEDWDELARESEDNPKVTQEPDSLAYLIYTSGSTGRPKSVMVSHRSMAAVYRSWQKPYFLDSSPCVLQMANFSFDVFTGDVLRGLMSGGRLVLCTQDTLLSPQALYELMRAEKVELAEFVPALLRQLLLYLEETRQTLDFMRVLISGSDALYAEEYKKLRWLCGDDARVFNTYGLTEATIDNLIFESSTADVNSSGAAPLGRPFAGVRIYLLDTQLQPVPVGVTGELYVGGGCLARGYLKRPDLTAARFIPNPFADEPGARLYQTGDLARFLPDGNIESLGRKDEQVKVRGYRIELGEIEAALKQHARVRDAVVVAGSNGDGAHEMRGEKRIFAYVVATGEHKLESKQLREFLAESLSEQMIPSAFVFLDAIPVTPNGKVDRRALPAPDFSIDFPISDIDDIPRTESERILVRIWSELLKLERIGRHDNFFHLGGDSILSIQVVARARQSGLLLTPRQIFEHPTIAALARTGEAISQTTDEQGRIAGDVLLTPIQRWFFEQNFPAPAHWNMSLLLEPNERLDLPLVESTVAHLLEHHDALRLRFVRENKGWRQFIAGSEEGCVRGVDLSGLKGAALESAGEATQKNLNLSEGPVLQVVLFDLGSAGQRLLFVIHHLVVDGVSWRILLEDWERVYRQLQANERVTLPAKTTSFQRWASRLDHLAQGPEVRRELDYWKATSGCLDLCGPLTAENTEGSSRTFTVSLSLDETDALLQHVPGIYHTRIDDALLTALARAFQRGTGADALLVELEKHGREELFEDVDLSRTVGWFTSAFPVLLKSQGTLAEALKSTKEQLRRIPHGGLCYGLLRYLCRDEEVAREMSVLPRAEVSFNYLGQLDQMFQSGLFRLARESSGTTRDRDAQRGNLLEINASIIGGQLQAEWTYSAELQDSGTVEKVAHNFLEELQKLIAHCLSTKAETHTPSDFPLARLNQTQLDELLQTSSDVTDLFHLSPMQQGMLFHILYAPNSDVYLGQFGCVLQGDLDAGALGRAWQQTINRHEVLRASFSWENLDEPLQLIHESVSVPLEQHDWRGLTDDEKSKRWEAFLISERERGFDLSTPPLMRLALVRLGDDSYGFVWTHHHLLVDGWSGALVLREVFDAYEALRRGDQVRAEPRRPFREYIAWLDRQDLSRAEVFWRERLRGFAAPTPLVIDHKETDVGLEAFGESKVQLSEETTGSLQLLARQHGLTLNTILVGAWALLLNRYSQEETVVFGATVAGRPPSLPGVETMIGLFINTLPVRVRVEAQAELLAWLRVLQAEQVALREYEYSPLVEVQSWSEVGRGRPLFESLLVFENYPLDADALKENLSLDLEDVRSFDRTNYPLTVVAIPADELCLQALYDRRRFTDGSIERLLGHLRTLLESIAARPSQPVGQLQLLTPREQQVLVEWNQTSARDYQQDCCLHEMFEAQVERTPGRVAAVHVAEELTYLELNARANKLAHYLQRLGVGPEMCVGVLMERSLEMLVALLGVLKAGGAYVPLDPEYPRERLGFMLNDSGARVLLTQKQLADLLPAHEARLVCLDTEWQAIDAESAENLQGNVTARNVAYVIYTSGSTGWPKGTAIEHRSAANFSYWARESFEPEAFNGTLALTSICFDLSIFELFVPLHWGGKVIIVADVLQVPAAHQVTLINTVPSAINQQLELDYLPDSAYVVNLAGEPLQQRLVQQLYERKTIEQVFNLYGPTEATTYATWGLMKRDSRESPTVGRPISNTQVYVLDPRGRPLPTGIPGELYIGGSGLARGYLGRPELTAEKFIPDPFSVEPGACMYRTGDLARFLPDGRIDFLGRIDHQVKIRGYRIELGEVEAALNEHPSVKTCVVVAREEADDDKRLVAYVVAHEGDKPAHLELQSFLRARLLEQMVPSAFVFLDEMPLTPNGKVNRRALPAPEIVRPELEQRYVAPRNDIEVVLVDLWQEVLGMGPIGVSDNFFDLGGHSLKATRLLSKVRRIFRTQLPLSVVFEATTIEALADALVEHEVKPGQTAKIARVLQRIKSISSAELKDELERKRREKKLSGFETKLDDR